MLARELESGTFRFAWTQSVGRGRWLIAKFGVLAVLVLICAYALGVVASWWVAPFNLVGMTSRWQAGQFDVTGLTLPAWSLFAFALGVTLGLLARRILTAMALSSVAMMGVLAVSFWRLDRFVLSIGDSSERVALRGHLEVLLGPLNHTAPQLRAWAPPSDRWLVTGWLSHFGHRLSLMESQSALGQALRARVARFTKSGADAWLRGHHFTYRVTFQPASHYAIAQGIVAGSLVILALLLGGFTSQRVRRARAASGSRRANYLRAPVHFRPITRPVVGFPSRATSRQWPQGSDSG